MKHRIFPTVFILSLGFGLTNVFAKGSPVGNEKELLEVVAHYRDSVVHRSVEEMAKSVSADLLVIEGTHVNKGWVDYRDNHIGPEMKEWEDFKVIENKILTKVLASDQAAVSEESIYRIKAEGKTTDLKAMETFVLKKENGAWKIAVIHFSGKPIVPKGQ